MNFIPKIQIPDSNQTDPELEVWRHIFNYVKLLNSIAIVDVKLF